MQLRFVAYAAGLAMALTLAQGRAAAQTPAVNAKPAAAKTAGKTCTPPRAADGHADISGVWANNNATPLQRPKELAGRATLTNEEVAAMRRTAAQIYDGKGDAEFGDTIFETVWAAIHAGSKGSESAPFRRSVSSFDGTTGDYSSVWLVARDWDNRTSLITDPPDGRMPPMTAEAQKRLRPSPSAAYDVAPVSGPEDLPLSVRCISFGSPRLGAGYNSYYQIYQTPQAVAMQMEMIHDARIIPLDGRPHLPSSVPTWLGDSRGHWEGDTLVVDSINYKAGAFMGTTEKLHVTERFTRTGPDVLQYVVTIDDPGTWTKPWTVMIPLRHSKDAIYEYACHEGNYGMTGILAGARAQDGAAAKATR